MFVIAAAGAVFAAVVAEALAFVISRSLLARLPRRGSTCLWAILALMAWGLVVYSITYGEHFLVPLYVQSGFWSWPVFGESLWASAGTVSLVPLALFVFPVSPVLARHARPSSSRGQALFLSVLIIAVLCAVFGVTSVSVQGQRTMTGGTAVSLLAVPFFIQMLVLFTAAKVVARRVIEQPLVQPQRGAVAASRLTGGAG